MKKRYKIPLIILCVLAALVAVYFGIKFIFPLKPNVGFHFEETQTVLLDYSNDPDMKVSVSTFFWDLIDERFVVSAGGNLTKIDSETGEIVAQTPLSEDENSRSIFHTKSGNILVNTDFKEEGADDFTRILREYTPDLQLLGEYPTPDNIPLVYAALIDDVFYVAANDLDSKVITLYTTDTKMNILTKETLDQSFAEGRELGAGIVRMGGDGKPFIFWHVETPDEGNEVRGGYNTPYITSFEAKPSFAMRLPQGTETEIYFGAGGGDEEYPIYVKFDTYPAWYDYAALEILNGEGVIGVKRDGTAEKIFVRDLNRTTMEKTGLGFTFLLNSTISRDGNIYYLEEDYGRAEEDTGQRLIMYKLEKVEN